MEWRHVRAKLRILGIRLFFLWLPFSLGCILLIPLSLIAVLSGSVYAKNMLLAMDKLAASGMTWAGHNTVSAECGRLLHEAKEWLDARCIFCRLLCWAINFFDAGHCRQNAVDERLLKE